MFSAHLVHRTALRIACALPGGGQYGKSASSFNESMPRGGIVTCTTRCQRRPQSPASLFVQSSTADTRRRDCQQPGRGCAA